MAERLRGIAISFACVLAAVALTGCPSSKPKTTMTDAGSAGSADKTRPGARVRLTAGDRFGQTGVVRGRTPDVAHELYDIVLDDGGDVVSSAPDRFELVNGAK